jgi:hypothetical protein
MSSSIAEQKAYVESLDRKAVEDGLRNGAPYHCTIPFCR